MSEPLVSIIIPGKNAESTFKKCLDSVLRLNYGNYEVIFVNDGSTDGTEKLLSDYPQINVINTKGIGPSAARNLALAQAKGEFVVFSDVDCIVDGNWLSELLSGFTDNNISAVGGMQKSPDDDSLFGKRVHEFLSLFGFISDYMKSASAIRKTKHNPSCNVMYRKVVLSELGGFLPGLWPGEDVELDYRINKKGYKLIFNPGAVVYHYRPDSFKFFSKMMFRYGMAQGWLIKKYGFFRRIQFVPVFIFIFLIFGSFNIRLALWSIAAIAAAVFLALGLRSKNAVTMFRFLIVALFWWNLGFMRGLLVKK